MEPLIDMVDVCKVYYGDDVETYALGGMNLRISAGEYVSIAGPSGCGKSTLLAVMGLLDDPTSGTYRLLGRDVTHLDLATRAAVRNEHIGFVFQRFNLIGDLTVRENVELPLRYRKVPPRQREQRVDGVLERVGMAHRRYHFPAQLSGGQQQRVAVARALAGEPSILLADEPAGNLDSTNGASIMELLQEVHAGGTTVCMVSHDPRYTADATRTVHLRDGRIVEVEVTRDIGGAPEEEAS